MWNKIEAMELDKQGVKWVMSKPLFYRPEPTKFVIEKIAQTAGKTPLDKVGVVLASHGELGMNGPDCVLKIPDARNRK